MREYIEKDSKNASKIIGFLGNDKSEYMMYLAAGLQQLKRKVLLIDLSDTNALTEVLQDSQEVEDNLNGPCIMDCRGIHYVSKSDQWQERMDVIRPYLYDEVREYDYILVDFGLQLSHTALTRCYAVLMISDMQKSNFMRMKPFFDMQFNNKIAVIKDIVSCKIHVKDMLPETYRDKVYLMDFNRSDFTYKVQMQYSRRILLKKLSKKMLEFLSEVICIIDSEHNKKEVISIIAKRGR